jgi:catechol 1,2-dioxygenase
MNYLTRRHFVQGATLWIATSACSETKNATAPAAAPSDATPPGAPAVDKPCAITEASIEGPYYRDGAPARADLADPGMPGTHIVLAGRVLAEDCKTPIEGAVLDLWQADSSGRYDNDGHAPLDPATYLLRGKLAAQKDGQYATRTVIPGQYLNGSQYRPAHIHVKVSAPGFRTITTQLYFEGDKYNGIDPFIHASLIMPIRDVNGVKTCPFDFSLQRA